MPPKARGRGGRGRGTSRGGSAVAASSAAAGDATATAPSEVKTEALDGTSNAAAAANEAQEASSAGQSGVSATIEGGSGPSDSRLDSLRTSTPSSRSASPARRGSTRGKKPSFNPTFTGRRSKTEREALEKVGKDRDKARLKEVEDEKKIKEREKRHDEQNRRKFNANRPGRGGFSGVPSGPFSLGSVAQDRRKSARDFASGSRATRVKREDGEGGRSGGGGGGGGGSGGGGGGGGEHGDDGSSDDDEDANIPRRDIDQMLIEISSDEEGQGSSERKSRSQLGHTISGLPVRISRKDHNEPDSKKDEEGLGLEAAAEARRQSHASGTAGVKLEPGEAAHRKGKAKSKDVEITEVRKPYKGMWQDNDESSPQIKSEPISDDEDMPDAVPAGLSDPSDKAAGKQPVDKVDAKKRPKIKRKALKKPIIQTKEDAQEWHRYLLDREGLLAELGPEKDTATEVDANGDVAMQDGDKPAEPKLSVRDNNPYIFQFPPTTPDVLPFGFKPEPIVVEPEPATTKTTAAARKASSSTIKADPAKEEEKSMFEHSGVVGTIRLHASGLASSTWGGTTFELNPGRITHFFEELSSITIVPEEERVVPEDGGEGASLGRIKGKFTMVPDYLAGL